ncbi:UNVERIFIED_CONTAM: hypothetical protein HDU68_003425, partial [Siphonaria sp. JEL0065]
GETIVSGSRDKTVKLWYARSGECTRTLEGHTFLVTSVAISADGETVVSGSYDKTVKLWDTRTGECTRTLEGHTFPVTSVAISADGKTVVSGSDDDTVKLWDTLTEKCLESFDSQEHSFDSVVNDFLGPAGNRGNVKLSDSWITDVSSKQLLYCPPLVDEFVSNGSAIFWTIDKNVVALTLTGHTERVRSVAISKNWEFVVSGSDDKTVKQFIFVTFVTLVTLFSHATLVTLVTVVTIVTIVAIVAIVNLVAFVAFITSLLQFTFGNHKKLLMRNTFRQGGLQ